MNSTADLLMRIADLEYRIANMSQFAPVHSVDAASGTCRLRLGGSDTEPVLSASIRYSQQMGALSIHTPPSPGQQMLLIQNAGNAEQAVAIPFSQSNKAPSPSTNADENVISYGDYTLTLRDDGLHIRGPNVTVESENVALGGSGGPKVARVGDHVHVGSGSSAGLWPIIEGSENVSAV